LLGLPTGVAIMSRTGGIAERGCIGRTEGLEAASSVDSFVDFVGEFWPVVVEETDDLSSA